MNKNLLIVGVVAIASYFTLTAFGGKTKAEQMAEIQEKVKMGLDDIRTEEKAKCDARVAEAVEMKYSELAAATPEPAPVKGVKKGSKGGPKAPVLPTGKAGTPTDPAKQRGGAAPAGSVEEAKKREGAAPAGNPTEAKKRGGAVKQGGGK